MVEFQTVTDNDLLKATLFNRARLAPSGCWEWSRGSRASYGLFYRDGKNQGAHRVSYEAFNGPIPDGMVVRHQCDNPKCINPDHLLVGTMADNAADREARGRRDVRGERIGTAKLTTEQVVAIKSSTAPLDDLARRYGVDRSNVWAIRAGRSWKHLNHASGLQGT